MINDFYDTQGQHDTRKEGDRKQETIPRTDATCAVKGCLGGILHYTEFTINNIKVKSSHSAFISGEQAGKEHNGKGQCEISHQGNLFLGSRSLFIFIFTHYFVLLHS